MSIIPNDIPKHFKESKIYNWKGVLYYKNQPCVEVNKIEVGIVIDHCGDRAGSFDVHDTGYIFGKTLGGNKHLLIEPVDLICPTCGKDITFKTHCSNLCHNPK